jgi:hypothetical protein
VGRSGIPVGRHRDWMAPRLRGIPLHGIPTRAHGPLRRHCRRHDVYLRQAGGSGLDRSGAPEENSERQRYAPRFVRAQSARKEGSHVAENSSENTNSRHVAAGAFPPGRYSGRHSERLHQRGCGRRRRGTRGRPSRIGGRRGWLRDRPSHGQEKAARARAATTAAATAAGAA